jgi:ABC-2 type transport system ATP-binding protein
VSPAIEVRSLTKHFGRVRAVDDLSFDVAEGRVTGFLGPNGSGKTTTLRMLLGLVGPSSGSATFGGVLYRDLDRPLCHVGAVLEATSFHPTRRAADHLRSVAVAARLPTSRVGEMLELVGLSDAARRRVGTFSLGMRQRLELATAVLGDPGVLILDEPANGLDPQGIQWLRTFIRYQASLGRAVLVSSHLLSEMEETVDDVVIVSEGRLVLQTTLAELASTAGGPSGMRVRTPELARLGGVLAGYGVTTRQVGADEVVVDGATPEWLGPVLAQAQIVVYELTRQHNRLEDVFLGLTQVPPGVHGTASSPPPPIAPPGAPGPTP